MKKIFTILSLAVVFVTCYGNKPSSLYTTSFAKNKEIKIAMLLPLFYENIDELSFNEYNIDEKRSKNYKCFSYISFYEGARIALDNLEKQGYKIKLYVFDVGENDEKKMQRALSYSQMKDMDLIIPLVFKQSFALVSSFCQTNNIPLINPMSQDSSILQNPYVFKIQPDEHTMSAALMNYVKQRGNASKIIVLYDDKITSSSILNYWKEHLPAVSEKWTIINYRKNAMKLKNYIAKDDDNVVINLINKSNEQDAKLYAQSVINSLLQTKCPITLVANYDWLNYVGNDLKQLQSLKFHFSLPYYNDYTNENFIEFVKQFRDNFDTEPDKIYAALGFDLIIYFLPLISAHGKEFVANPINTKQQKMIARYKFERAGTDKGWQNINTTIYKLDNYKIKSCWSY